jgi:hypothetical protein
MSEEKLQIAIYKINEEKNLFSETENTLSILSEHVKSKGFFPQELESNLNDNYEIELFYKKNPLKPKWKLFLKDAYI